MKLLISRYKVLFTMQKGVDVYCSTNKVIATLPRQLSLAVLWTVTLCQWFWVKKRLWVDDAEKLFFLSQKDSMNF